MRIGIVTGDDVLPPLRDNPAAFPHLETAQPLSTVLPSLVTANAYVGAAPVIEALSRGGDIIITGRVADPSLTVARAAHHFGGRQDDFDRPAAAQNLQGERHLPRRLSRLRNADDLRP